MSGCDAGLKLEGLRCRKNLQNLTAKVNNIQEATETCWGVL